MEGAVFSLIVSVHAFRPRMQIITPASVFAPSTAVSCCKLGETCKFYNVTAKSFAPLLLFFQSANY